MPKSSTPGELNSPPHDFHLIQKASSFAARHHRDHQREDGTPYITHPFRVALTLRDLFQIHDLPTTCAALLHDVIEKGGVKYDELFNVFGEEIADLVAGMSKDFRLPEAAREEEFEERIRNGTWKLKAIKLADVYDNLSDGKDGAREKAERAVASGESEQRLQIAVDELRDLISVAAIRESADRNC